MRSCFGPEHLARLRVLWLPRHCGYSGGYRDGFTPSSPMDVCVSILAMVEAVKYSLKVVLMFRNCENVL